MVLVYPVPEVGYDVPSTLARLALKQRPIDSFTRPFSAYKNRQKAVFAALDDVGPSDHLIRIYPHERLCDETRCIVSLDGQPLYHDDDHLSLVGADYVAPSFEPAFAPTPSGGPGASEPQVTATQN